MEKMTNEKAKECIDAIIGTWEICQNQKYPSAVDVEIDAEDIVALKMAITALSQEQQSELERDHEVLKAYADGQESMKPCGDAISRQAAIDAMATWDWQELYLPIHFKQLLEDLPSVSTEKTGLWEWNQYDYNPNLGNWHCSECRSVVIECVDKNKKSCIPLYKYCPQCGAKMEVEE